MKSNLEATARVYVKNMTSIRSRRVHRLLIREFSRFKDVFLVTAEDGTRAVLELDETGKVATLWHPSFAHVAGALTIQSPPISW